jgi:hypothetical protein
MVRQLQLLLGAAQLQLTTATKAGVQHRREMEEASQSVAKAQAAVDERDRIIETLQARIAMLELAQRGVRVPRHSNIACTARARALVLRVVHCFVVLRFVGRVVSHYDAV